MRASKSVWKAVSKGNMTQPELRAKEAELIQSVCDGKREAFYELVRPYERMVYATAISVLKNPADAEEVAQEAVLKAFSKLASFRGESKFSTWLVQITVAGLATDFAPLIEIRKLLKIRRL